MRTPEGQRLITKLKELIPRQLYDVAIQASAGGTCDLALRRCQSHTQGMRRTKCYGGDITRKKKLLEKQKKGKKRLTMQLEIPQDAFMAIFDEEE